MTNTDELNTNMANEANLLRYQFKFSLCKGLFSLMLPFTWKKKRKPYPHKRSSFSHPSRALPSAQWIACNSLHRFCPNRKRGLVASIQPHGNRSELSQLSQINAMTGRLFPFTALCQVSARPTVEQSIAFLQIARVRWETSSQLPCL